MLRIYISQKHKCQGFAKVKIFSHTDESIQLSFYKPKLTRHDHLMWEEINYLWTCVKISLYSINITTNYHSQTWYLLFQNQNHKLRSMLLKPKKTKSTLGYLMLSCSIYRTVNFVHLVMKFCLKAVTDKSIKIFGMSQSSLRSASLYFKAKRIDGCHTRCLVIVSPPFIHTR